MAGKKSPSPRPPRPKDGDRTRMKSPTKKRAHDDKYSTTARPPKKFKPKLGRSSVAKRNPIKPEENVRLVWRDPKEENDYGYPSDSSDSPDVETKRHTTVPSTSSEEGETTTTTAPPSIEDANPSASGSNSAEDPPTLIPPQGKAHSRDLGVETLPEVQSLSKGGKANVESDAPFGNKSDSSISTTRVSESSKVPKEILTSEDTVPTLTKISSTISPSTKSASESSNAAALADSTASSPSIGSKPADIHVKKRSIIVSRKIIEQSSTNLKTLIAKYEDDTYKYRLESIRTFSLEKAAPSNVTVEIYLKCLIHNREYSIVRGGNGLAPVTVPILEDNFPQSTQFLQKNLSKVNLFCQLLGEDDKFIQAIGHELLDRRMRENPEEPTVWIMLSHTSEKPNRSMKQQPYCLRCPEWLLFILTRRIKEDCHPRSSQKINGEIYNGECHPRKTWRSYRKEQVDSPDAKQVVGLGLNDKIVYVRDLFYFLANSDPDINGGNEVGQMITSPSPPWTEYLESYEDDGTCPGLDRSPTSPYPRCEHAEAMLEWADDPRGWKQLKDWHQSRILLQLPAQDLSTMTMKSRTLVQRVRGIGQYSRVKVHLEASSMHNENDYRRVCDLGLRMIVGEWVKDKIRQDGISGRDNYDNQLSE
ncbi:hypothetical protein B0J14DRAFT_700997 [Halenospora varia]|nr:hypothetical protein B0J14DRAFT_700997 [Halenospora varia]